MYHLSGGKEGRFMHEWVFPYVKQNKGRVLLTVFVGLLGITSAAMLLFISGYLISKSALRPENIMIIYVPIVSVRAFSIGQAVFPYLERLFSHNIVLTILAKYRRRLYDILEPQALFLQSRYQTGDLLSVLSDDIERLQDFYIRTLFPSLIGLVVYTVFIIVIGSFNLLFMLLIGTMLGIIVFLMPLLSYYMMRKRHQTMKEAKGKLYRRITDAMFGQLDWLVSGRTDEIVTEVAKTNEQYIQVERNINQWHHIRDAFLRLVSSLVIIAIMIWASLQVGQDAFSPTVIAAFVLMTFSIVDALLPMSDAVEEVPIYQDALKRMNELQNAEQPEQLDGSIHALEHPQIDVKNVSYRYAEGQPKIINQLSLTIQPGEKIAILGKSGAGKSTLLKLLAGVILPDKGDIVIADQTMHKSYLAKAVSVLNQKPHLFHTTIANNVRIGRQSATDEEVVAALEKAQMMELINKLPDGIHTQMEEMGKRFSGGERQRIAFARILLQDTPILLMDEPTTGLDAHTERDLIETILQAASHKTIIWVTHRLAGARLMDDIIFLRDGKINFRGSHEKLYKMNDYYRTLYEMDRGY